jgi:methylenetetrahydrofolate dehydrogenase (NADP+)/methenyltetrahydrofolate cyclohydrolase
LTALENIIDGRAIADQIHDETRQRIVRLNQRGVEPGLAFVRVGEDPASKVYVGMKQRTSERLGIRSRTQVLDETTSQTQLLSLLAGLDRDPAIHGILVQAPLPRHIDSTVIYGSVAPEKDVDGFHPVNAGKLMLGDPTGFVPCTPAGVHELLRRTLGSIEGAHVVVLGRGVIVGKPLATLLSLKRKDANATVTLCHSQTRDIPGHCQRADILVAALGSPQFVTRSMVRPGTVIIDVGVNRVPDASAKGGSRLVGDVDFADVQPVARWITPNPGGVGPMTIAMLMQNTVRAAEMKAGISP